MNINSTTPYHIGLTQFENSAVIELADDVDFLSCDAIEYLGYRTFDQEKFHEVSDLVLTFLNQKYNRHWSGIEVWYK